jgi:hypothetical protein
MKHLSKIFFISNILILIFLLIQGFTKTTRITDFRDYYRAASLYTQNKDIYQYEEALGLQKKFTINDLFLDPKLIEKLESLKGNIASYIYPPTFAVLLIPISYLSYENASLVFFLINYISLLGSLFFIFKMTNSVNFSELLFVTLIFNLRFLENHINNNQVAFFLLFLILLAIYIKNDLLSGILLSLAVVIKLTPLIFILYYIFERRWKALLYFIVGLGFWFIVPLIYDYEFGLQNWKNWIDMVLMNAMKNPVFRSWKNNQSLISTLAKYFLDTADPPNQMLFRLPLINLTTESVKILFYSISFLLGIPLLTKFRKNISTLGYISLLFTLSVLLSGVSWVHSFSFFIVPIAYIYEQYLYQNRNKKIFTALMVSGGMIILSTKQFSGFLESFFLMYSILLYVGILIYYTTNKCVNEEDPNRKLVY